MSIFECPVCADIGWCNLHPRKAPLPPSLHREPIEADREAVPSWFKAALRACAESGNVLVINSADAKDILDRLAFSTPAASDAAQMREACAKVTETWGERSTTPGEPTIWHAIGKVIAADIRALPLPKAGEMETETAFEIWEDDLMVASASTEAEGLHYFAVYSQEGPVKLVRAETVRKVIAAPSTEGHKGEDQADG